MADGPGAGGDQELSDQVELVLPDTAPIVSSKRALVSRSTFFAPLVDEPGVTRWDEAVFKPVLSSLPPGTRDVLPTILQALGGAAQPDPTSLFVSCGLFHVFAAASILGASHLLDSAREWATTDSFRLTSAVAAVDAKKDAAVLRIALRLGLDAGSPQKLLHVAAAADAVDCLNVLLNEEDALGDLAVAATSDVDSVLFPVDMRDAEGLTALHVAAIHNSAGAASTLIEASAAIDALCHPPDDEEADEHAESHKYSVSDPPAFKPAGIRTALHLAAANDAADVVQLLLEKKADITSRVRGVQCAVTPLHECAPADAARSARVLAIAAAQTSAMPEFWNSQLLASQGGSAAGEKEASILPELPLAGKLEPENQQTNCTADASPAEDDDRKVQWSRFLDPLQAKVGILGFTPLHSAAEEDAPGVVRELLLARADPNLSDDQGDTPVNCAVLYASPRALAELIEHGAQITHENDAGELPIHQIAEFGLGDSSEDELSQISIQRHFARCFKTQGILVEALRMSGQLESALGRASSVDGYTPLHSVALRNHPGAVHAAKLMVEASADLAAKGGDGRTPTQLAVKRHGENAAISKFLLESSKCSAAKIFDHAGSA